MRCLYVGYEYSEGKIGANILRKNNNEILKEIFQLNVDNFFIKNEKNVKKLLNNFLTLSFNGGNKKVKNEFYEKIKSKEYTHIFFDGSLFGELAKKINKEYPQIEIITFFHNVEINYYKSRIKAEGIKGIIPILSVAYNEKMSFKYSDKIIALNERDRDELIKIYKEKKIDLIPMFMEDKYNKNRKIEKSDYEYLFIGSAFFANIEGISWFIENVLPMLPGKLLVIGNGMEILNKKYEHNLKVKILGTVDDIEEYYYQDNIVVSPIFLGSGMKTKTIEALMYNKKIFGTKEAFIGIDKISEIECNTKKDFIEKIGNTFNFNSRKIFLENFSREIILEKFKKIILRKNWR